VAGSSVIRDVEAAGAWLESLINFERRPGFSYSRMGLDPIRRVLDRLGNPQASLSTVHVAGSKGKGSTCLFGEAILRAAGEHVGTFTSPHLERWTERFRIDGREVDGDALTAAVEAVRPHVEALRREDPRCAPTFFDATTAAALVLFERAGVHRALLEVGLGGRLDSTNVVSPAVTCVTQIELEHVDKLGGTLAEIASEKAGILKPGVPCVVGDLVDEACAVVLARAESLGAPVLRWGIDFSVDPAVVEAPGRLASRLRYAEPGGFRLVIDLPVRGAHQVHNAALALAMVRALGVYDDPTLALAAERGLAAVSLPGRVEVLAEQPCVIVDSAHTRESARSLGQVLAGIDAARRHLVLSVSSDKDARALLEALAWRPDVVWLTRAEPIRSTDPERLVSLVRDWAPVAELCVEADPHRAVRAARAQLSPADLLCCTGSVYLAGVARRVLREDMDRDRAIPAPGSRADAGSRGAR
jgi:dihydrofolate synthase/folylpolyglutamate synthase